MLQARAYLADYYARSERVTEQQAQQQLANLAALSPERMRVWLAKFQRELKARRLENRVARELRNEAVARQQASPQVDRYRDVGESAARVPPADLGPAVEPTDKPFAGVNYYNQRGPLVDSRDVARYEILRGLWYGWPSASPSAIPPEGLGGSGVIVPQPPLGPTGVIAPPPAGQ